MISPLLRSLVLAIFLKKNKDTKITEINLDETLLKEAHTKAIKSFERRLKQLEKVDKKEFTNRFFDVVAQITKKRLVNESLHTTAL